MNLTFEIQAHVLGQKTELGMSVWEAFVRRREGPVQSREDSEIELGVFVLRTEKEEGKQ